MYLASVHRPMSRSSGERYSGLQAAVRGARMNAHLRPLHGTRRRAEDACSAKQRSSTLQVNASWEPLPWRARPITTGSLAPLRFNEMVSPSICRTDLARIMQPKLTDVA
jgi:hypothetical protein